MTATEIRPKRNSEFSTRLLPDGYVLIHSELTTWVHTLTPLGGLVWEFCDGSHSASDIVESINSHTQNATQRDDVEKLLKEFQDKGLLESP